MRVLILGGTGFIGSAVATRLRADGHECITASRSAGTPPHLRLDLSAQPGPGAEELRGIDAVVNAAGVLQESSRESAEAVHVAGTDILYGACELAGVRRVIHLSAIGVDKATPTAFSKTKREAEIALGRRDLDWVVLRPSVVIGRSAYGGSALLRGLAALPILPVMPDTAPIQPVHLDDVVETIVRMLHPAAPSRIALDLAGPKRMSFTEAVQLFRRWLRWRPAVTVTVPSFLARLFYWMGDAALALGWRTPINTTAQAEMRRGAIGDPKPWQTATGITPRDVEAALMREPSSVQEHWFARLYALKPLVFGVFGVFWIATGLISLGPGFEYGMSLLREGGLPERFGVATLVAGALADIAIGCAILYRPLSRYGLWAALAISLVYVVVGTSLVPRLWSDPLGPMLKIWPVLMLNLVALAIREDR